MRVFVTGDSRGLGNTLCHSLVADGISVLGCSRNKPDNCTWDHIDVDLSNFDPKDLQVYLRDCDAIIHNAAIASSNISIIEKEANIRKLFEVNVLAPIMISNCWATERIRSKKSGSVIFISSICSKSAMKGLSMYGTTKAAINSFSKTFALEMSKFSITSNCILPGYMETDMSSAIDSEKLARIKSKTPLKRFLQVEEVYEAVKFLLDEKTSFMTGSEITIDGGYTL